MARGGRDLCHVRAPGRVNLIGEHTDYNDGFVLPIAIDRSVAISFRPTDDRSVTVELSSTGEVDGLSLDAIGPRTGRWIDYVAATAWAMAEAGLPVSGFRGVLESDLPQGAGLSSSAALELAAALALAGGNEPPVDRLALARIAQRGENEYVGVACGLMDQFASACGEVGAALLLDCRSLEHRPVPIALDDVALAVIDSGSPRRLGQSGYNERRAQCEAAVAEIARHAPGISSLRDVTPAMLDDAAGDLEPVLAGRARHVVEENDRVLAAVDAIEANDMERLGELLRRSHVSLRDLFEVSSPELDALVEIAEGVPGVLGSRLTGAGFGGCTITLVRRDALGTLREAVLDRYPGRTGLHARMFEVSPGGGAEVVRGRP
jgi:galactokinase